LGKKTKPVTALTYDLIFQNPYIAPRLPPASELLKGIFLGATRSGNPVGWNYARLPNHHVIVLGPPGSGKTCLSMSFIYRACVMQGIPFWVFDPHKQYDRVVKDLGGMIIDMREEKVNPFVLYGAEPVSVANRLSEFCAYLVGLVGAERFLFRKSVLELYEERSVLARDARTWTDEKSNKVNFVSLAKYIKRRLKLGAYGKDSSLAMSILDKIEPLVKGKYAFSAGTISLAELFESKTSVCFRLAGLPDYLQKGIVWTVLEGLNSLMYNRYAIFEELRLLVLVEEAWMFAKPVEADVPGGRIVPPLAEFARHMRKMGFGLVLITHASTDLEPTLFEQVGTLFILPSRAGEETEYSEFCRKQLNLLEEDIKAMSWMRRGQAFMRHHGDPRPVAINVVPEPIALKALRAEG